MNNYIQKISEYCRETGDKYGGKLIELMERHGAMNLQQITEDQAKAFYEELINNK